MNQQIKTKWVTALRSGKYNQTRSVLKDSNGYCCLGVLCEVSKQMTGFGIAENKKEIGKEECLGTTITKWAELSSRNGNVVIINGKLDNLASHNDSFNTFLEIATAIEAQL